MKKLFTIVMTAATLLFSQNAVAQETENVQKDKWLLNHVSLNLGVGTTGISIEAATPLSRWVDVRAGVSIVPGIKINTDADVEYSAGSMGSRSSSVDLEGNLKRIQGQILFNIYPFTHGAFHVTAGAYFGAPELLKIDGYSADLAALGSNAGVVIGDYTIPVVNGHVSGGVRVNSFRPYLGIGWGRAVSDNRLNFNIDLGVQFHGKPHLYTNAGEIEVSSFEDDNDIQKIMDAVKVYPTLTFRLGFRAF